jgi:ATP-dependent Lhr-like helicase
VGEQFALPEALDLLRETAASRETGTEIRISASDPLNLTGILLPGPRVPAVRGRLVTIRDGNVQEVLDRELHAVAR